MSVYFWLLVRRFDPVTFNTFAEVLEGPGNLGNPTAARIASMNVYLFVALRTVYGQHVGVTILKVLVLSAGFLALFILWVLLVFATGLRK